MTIRSLGLRGISGYEVSVECYLSGGLPAFDMVGLPDTAVREARERVRAAVKNCGFTYPVNRITVNLAPAHIKKIGTLYDLPMLIGILSASGQIFADVSNCAFIGELSLSGELRPAFGTLSMALCAKRAGIAALYVPEDNAPEATLADGPTLYPVRDVRQLIRHLNGAEKIPPAPQWTPHNATISVPDFNQVKGQDSVKRALEIAAAGSHNVLMVGPPGSGKSMLARRLPGILPEMTRREALEATEVHSVVGLTNREHPLIDRRPFRAPHHTISIRGMTGGGANPKPGEISLAHHGILFLDELPEFPKEALEILRQPMEEGVVHLARATASVTYPSDFMLVCAMNPCRCGWFGHPSGRCKCTERDVKQYLSKLSGPLLDRIDLFVEVAALEFEELAEPEGAESSAEVKKRVDAARSVQNQRGPCNAKLGPGPLDKYCTLDDACQKIMKGAYERLGLTARGYDRIRRVARTIADLDGCADIQAAHLSEALQYRPPEYLRR